MTGPLPVRDFAASPNALAEMQAHYSASRARLNGCQPPAPLTLPERREISTIPPPDYVMTRDAYARVASERRNDERLHRPLLRIVAVVSGIAIDDLISQNRAPVMIKARQIAYWLIHRAIGNVKDTGRRLQRDHTTVLHGLGRVNRVISGLGIEVCDDPVEMCARLWAADWRAAR
jgi:hypothetical protein